MTRIFIFVNNKKIYQKSQILSKIFEKMARKESKIDPKSPKDPNL